MNQAQLEGTIRHALTTIGTILLMIGGFNFLPESWTAFMTEGVINGAVTAIMGVVGAGLALWQFIKSLKAPEKTLGQMQNISPAAYKEMKSA